MSAILRLYFRVLASGFLLVLGGLATIVFIRLFFYEGPAAIASFVFQIGAQVILVHGMFLCGWLFTQVWRGSD